MRAFPTLNRSSRSATLEMPAARLWAVAARAHGDERGQTWYADAAPFVVRGGLDRLALGRGRRWPLPDRPLLERGDHVGFWEVVEVDHTAHRLAMVARVRAPGTVRMELSVAGSGASSCVLTLAISFEPRGLLGTAYVVSDLPAREVVVELTHRRLLADVAAAV